MRKKFFAALISGFLVFVFVSWARSAIEIKNKDEMYRQVQLFADTLAIIQSEYVDEVTPKDMIYGSLKGMLSALDAHSQFMDPDTYNELKVDTEGKFGGLGIEITVKDSLLTVVTPIDDTPAWKAGIKAGDRIVRIDNEMTRDMTLSEAVKIMRGKPGEAVNLTILRESEKKLLEFKIVRDMIKIKDIKEARILEDGIGYIRLVEFRENTSQEIDSALENLSKSGLSGLILDLRNNPGGLLEVAVKVTEKFIEPGKIVVTTKGRKASQNMEFRSRQEHPILNIPVVVLINEGSDSGSEIVAGCLQDYKRAIILGMKSFGKGSVQTVIPLSDGSGLRLTTSKYFTPLGKIIHEKGVTPDIVVEEEKLEPEEENKKESKPQEIFEELEKKGKLDKSKESDKAFDYKGDNQLMQAINVLKVAKFYEGGKP
jgi:carboxyl-terminal processing protease